MINTKLSNPRNVPRSPTGVPKSWPWPQIDQIDLDHDTESTDGYAKSHLCGATHDQYKSKSERSDSKY